MSYLEISPQPTGAVSPETSKTKWLLLGVAALGAFFFFPMRGGRRKKRDERWVVYEVMLYNYPVGHPDRRSKGSLGVFKTRQAAERAAAKERDFYTHIAKRMR